MRVRAQFKGLKVWKKLPAFTVLVLGMLLLENASWSSDPASLGLSGMTGGRFLMPKSLDFEPAQPAAGDAIRVRVTFEGEPTQLMPLTYRWKVNDQVAVDSISPELQYATKRGDVVEVVVFLGDNRNENRAFRKCVTVANSTPAIERRHERFDEEGRYVAQFEVTDPDGDAVNLQLLKGPEGMALDAAKAEISWSPPEGSRGTFAVELLSVDSSGAQVLYTYSLTLK